MRTTIQMKKLSGKSLFNEFIRSTKLFLMVFALGLASFGSCCSGGEDGNILGQFNDTFGTKLHTEAKTTDDLSAQAKAAIEKLKTAKITSEEKAKMEKLLEDGVLESAIGSDDLSALKEAVENANVEISANVDNKELEDLKKKNEELKTQLAAEKADKKYSALTPEQLVDETDMAFSETNKLILGEGIDELGLKYGAAKKLDNLSKYLSCILTMEMRNTFRPIGGKDVQEYKALKELFPSMSFPIKSINELMVILETIVPANHFTTQGLRVGDFGGTKKNWFRSKSRSITADFRKYLWKICETCSNVASNPTVHPMVRERARAFVQMFLSYQYESANAYATGIRLLAPGFLRAIPPFNFGTRGYMNKTVENSGDLNDIVSDIKGVIASRSTELNTEYDGQYMAPNKAEEERRREEEKRGE